MDASISLRDVAREGEMVTSWKRSRSEREWRTKTISDSGERSGGEGRSRVWGAVETVQVADRLLQLVSAKKHNFDFLFLSEWNHCLFLSTMKHNFIYLFLSATKNLTKRAFTFILEVIIEASTPCDIGVGFNDVSVKIRKQNKEIN